MGIKNLTSYSRGLEEFCRQNIYFVLQRKFGWIYPDSPLAIERRLYEQYLVHAGFKNDDTFRKKLRIQLAKK